MKVLFLLRMPERIKPILSISDGTITKLAEMADKMMEASTSNVASANAFMSAPSGLDLTRLQEQIASLTAEVRRLKAPGSRNRSSSRSRLTSETADGICCYHRKYGRNARACRDPCSFDASKN